MQIVVSPAPNNRGRNRDFSLSWAFCFRYWRHWDLDCRIQNKLLVGAWLLTYRSSIPNFPNYELGCCQKPLLPATGWRWHHALGQLCLTTQCRRQPGAGFFGMLFQTEFSQPYKWSVEALAAPDRHVRCEIKKNRLKP